MCMIIWFKFCNAIKSWRGFVLQQGTKSVKMDHAEQHIVPSSNVKSLSYCAKVNLIKYVAIIFFLLFDIWTHIYSIVKLKPVMCIHSHKHNYMNDIIALCSSTVNHRISKWENKSLFSQLHSVT